MSLIVSWKLLFEVHFLDILTQSLNYQVLFYSDCAEVVLVPALFLLYLQGILGVLIIPFYQDVIRDYFGKMNNDELPSGVGGQKVKRF